MKKNNTVKAAALGVVAVTMAGSVLPVYAEGEENVTKNESVYTVLNADGSVQETTVSDTLHSDTGFKNYSDTSDLKDVENLKSTDKVATSADGLSWTTDAKDIYYQGKSDKELPLKVKISYFLDGKEMDEKDMLGKSGHVMIKISVTNDSKQTYKVNGKSYELVTPFVTVAGAMMDDDNFSNVTIDHGTVSSDSSHDIVAGVMIPGLRKGLNAVVDADTMSSLSSYIIDDLTIEADATDFVSPNIMLAASTDMEALQDDIKDADFADVFGDLDKLKDATNQLLQGTQDLYDGASQLSDGAGQLDDGAQQLLAGANKLADGASQVSAGTGSLVDGLGQLSSKSAEIAGGATNLKNGVFTIANAVLQAKDETKGLPELTVANYPDVLEGKAGISSEQIDYAVGKMVNTITDTGASEDDAKKILFTAVTSGDQSLSNENITAAASTLGNAKQKAVEVNDAAGKAAQGYEDPKTDEFLTKVKTYTANNTSDADMYAAVKANVVSGLNAAAGSDVSTYADTIIAYSVEHYQAQAFDAASLKASLEAVMAGARPQAGTQMTNPYVKAVVTAAYKQTAMATANSDIYSQVIDKVMATGVDAQRAALVVSYGANYGNYDGTADATAYLTGVGTALTTLQNMNNALEANYNTDASNSLIRSKAADRVSSDMAGNEQLKSIKDLLDGAIALDTGIAKYTAGVDSAFDGAKKLQSGASQVSDGAKTLKDGVAKLSDGTSSLKTGSDALADGAKTLMNGMKEYNDEGISKLTENDKIHNLQDAADLMDAVKEQGDSYDNYSGISEGAEGKVKFVYKVSGAKAPKASKSVEEKTEDKGSFWDRVVNLFNISTLFNNNK